MDKVNLVVMGKTGAGKSTLINSVLEEDLAPTGSGQAVTKENRVYSKNVLLPLRPDPAGDGHYGMVGKTLNLYDTVGLEIDSSVTRKTLHEIKNLIQKAQESTEENDISVVWFCVNWHSDRFEHFEIELIRSLSLEYEIPFVLVLTQCISDGASELENTVKSIFPEIPIVRVLAKEYRLRSGVVSAYGTAELLQRSIQNFPNQKIRILESKLERLLQDRTQRIAELKTAGMDCIASYSCKARNIGFVPGGCIPVVHTMCIAMLTALNQIAGIKAPKGVGTNIFANTMLGLFVTPLMAVPLFSTVAAKAYIETVGEGYLDALIAVVEQSTDRELEDNNLVTERIKAEIKKRKGNDHE